MFGQIRTASILWISLSIISQIASFYNALNRIASSQSATKPVSNDNEVKRKFKVTVYEHVTNEGMATTREQAVRIMMANIEIFRQQAILAKSQGAVLIVFPEYGVTGDILAEVYNRRSIYPYMEKIGEPNDLSECRQLDCTHLTKGREGQQGLACIAKILNMYVAGNIIEERPCKGQDSCPCDGHYQYNTNVIYNKTGCLVARYRKAHLYEKELLRLDKPPTQEYVYFDTEYGRFGTEICFDITFKQPGVDLVEKYGIDHLVFPTYWPNDLGFLFANMVQWSSGWARRMGVNFLAANVHNMSRYSYGSAISSPNAVLNSTYITGPSAGTLLTADLDIPCAPKQKMLVQHDLPHNEVTNFQDQITTSVYQVVKLAGFLFNTTVLTGEKGLLEVTSEQLLCQLSFERSTTNETFLLAAYSGPSLFSTHIEVCLLQKCLNPDPSSCNNRDNEWSRTSFPKLILRGRFRHNYVLPSITGSFYQYTEIDWDFHHVKDRNYIISKDKTTPMLTVSMLGVW